MAEGGREASGEIRQMKDRGMSNTVEVSGFSTNTSQELLENYFENSRRSGGGDMEEIRIRDGVAYITFKNAEVAQRVVSCNNHQVDGRTLTVTLLHTSPPRSYYTNRVLIQGLNSAVTEDLLRNFLEAVTESEVREFLYGEEEGNVVVTLSDNIDIGQLRKTFQERRIEGAVLKVERVAISRCILVQNIQTSMSHDVVLFYFDNKRKSGGGNVERVEMKADEGYCLVYFEDHSVVDRVLSQSHKVDGVDLEVHLHYECLGQRSSRNKSDPYLRISNPVNKGSSTLEEENTDNQSNDEDSSSVSSNPDKESDFVEVQERQESEDEDSSSVSSNPDKESDFLEVRKMQESEDEKLQQKETRKNHPKAGDGVSWIGTINGGKAGNLPIFGVEAGQVKTIKNVKTDSSGETCNSDDCAKTAKETLVCGHKFCETCFIPMQRNHVCTICSQKSFENTLGASLINPRKVTKISDASSNCDTCIICMEKLDTQHKLPCGHDSFHKKCIDEAFVYKEVCPLCGKVLGTVTGSQPEGTMKMTKSGRSLPGYEDCGLIEIFYEFQDGIQTEDHPHPRKPFRGTRRKAYLPDNHEGQTVLEMLKVAFERKLVFTIGESRTTGRTDTVTWNDIIHKTRMEGGPSNYGYPDPDYLRRVKDELKAMGVTEADIYKQ